MIKPTIPSGTRDFSPEEVYKRQYIFSTVRSVFEKYGYQPIETPTMETLSTLEGKYGEEGDRLLYRVLNSGDFLKEVDKPKLETRNSKLLLSEISEKGLRYDLTVPFARYVVMHQNEITFPFKRYQMQPVFRADRPQRGRYREFFQCDADVVGSDSLLNEMELIRIYDEVFTALKLNVTIKVNNRKVLAGMAESSNAIEKLIDITIAIDKLDIIGIQGVRQVLTEKGISESQLQIIERFFGLQGKFNDKLSSAKKLLSSSETGMKGIFELEKVDEYLAMSGATKNPVEVDFTLARGLNYYTGAIIEVKPNDVSMGSLGGGGRYDDLTGMFGLKGVSGVGISFGADRIYDVMEELKLFPASAAKGTQVLFCYFDEAFQNYCLPLVKQVRDAGVAAEIYPSPEKMKKQLKYANDKKIPFVAVVGAHEMQSGKLAFKDMESGEQTGLTIDEIIQRIR
ncbi:MAG: histidine--tRNA ligase [Chitinophagales bacterium]